MKTRFDRRQAIALLAAGTAGLPALRAFAATSELRIGYQKSSVSLMVTRERKLLDATLPGVSVKWVEFPAGPQILEALAVGSLDFGFTGDTPPVFAQPRPPARPWPARSASSTAAARGRSPCSSRPTSPTSSAWPTRSAGPGSSRSR